MADNVDLLLNATPRAVGRTVPGAPTLSVHRRREGVEARSYGGLRGLTDYMVSPHRRRTNPSVTALRAVTAPLSGEPRGWEEVCGVCASDCRDADTCVSLPPVRGGVPDAPWLRDCRGALDAPVRRDLLHPRHLRRACLASTTQRIQSRGHRPRTICTGVRRYPFTDAGRAWKPAPTVRCVG